MYLHKDGARYPSIGAKAGDIVVEASGNVEANVVGNCKQQAVTGETTVDAEEDVTISVLVKMDDSEQNINEEYNEDRPQHQGLLEQHGLRQREMRSQPRRQQRPRWRKQRAC